jgi:hypothetical protein
MFMIESFFFGTWIGGQTLYWLFFKARTETACEEFWEANLLRFSKDP